MSLLFIKIFIYAIILVIIAAGLKTISFFLAPRLAKKKYQEHFRHFIQKNIYDRQTINRASLCYVPPKFQKFNYSTDKKDKKKLQRKDLTRVLDLFLGKGTRTKHLLILAESGAGKTCFAVNYYLHNKTKPRNERYNLVLVPMGLKNSDQLIISPSDKKNSVLFLDGLNEDIDAGQNPHKRFLQILKLAASYRKIIITCRINFFPKHRNMPTRQGYEIIGPLDKKDDHLYELKKVYLSPMSLAEAGKILTASLPFGKKRIGEQILEHIKSNSSMGITPFTLSYFARIHTKSPGLVHRKDVYRAIIQTWVVREKHWEDKALLNKFLRNLALDLFIERFRRGQEAVPSDEIMPMAAAWGITLYPFNSDDASLISRDKSGTLRFSHRSIMEYLFVEHLISGENSCYRLSLTGNMKKFLFEFLNNNQSLDLSRKFLWLSQYKLDAHGLKRDHSNKDETTRKNLFHAMLTKNLQYKFLARLNDLLKNPIFHEFGWETKLNENLKLALFQSESSLLYLKKQKRQILINPKTIEITKHKQRIGKILFKEKEVKEYSRLEDNHSLITLNQAIGLSGLKILNSINQAGNLAVLPDLKTPGQFTVYFEILSDRTS